MAKRSNLIKSGFLNSSSMYFLRVASLFAFALGSNCVLPSGRIPPPADCDDKIENPKFYHERCSNDTECFGGPNSMVCKNGRCQCAEDYLPEERFTGENSVQTVCVSAPSLFEKCNTTCQKPAVCLLYRGEGSDGKTKICQCVQPYRFENGLCYLNCKEDEYYEPSKYKCIKRCTKNEAQFNDTCYPLADLGWRCQTDSQCQTPFSECKSNLCACKPGFYATRNSICYPKSVSCPYGEPLKRGHQFVACRILEEQESSGEQSEDKFVPPVDRQKRRSDCPKGAFCLIPSGDYNLQPNSAGFCCPNRPPACPVGSPHPTAKCGSHSPEEKSCPWSSHFCQSQSPASGDGDNQLCCPKTCSSDFVQIDKRCVPRVHLGNGCFSKDQCIEAYSDCIQGVCKCKAGAKEIDSRSNRYCSFVCDADEVLHGDKCQKRLKLAEICSQNKNYLCPEYAVCSPKNQCVCQCGAFTLADNVCAPPPICRPPIHIFPFDAAAGGSGSTPLPPIPRISDEEREKLLKNTTFCKVKGQNPPAGVKVAEKCPNNQYCSQYITRVGLCCKKPEPFCPWGGKPKQGTICDPKNPLSCGLDNTCVKYLYPVDQDENSKDYTVCCSKSVRRPDGIAPHPE